MYSVPPKKIKVIFTVLYQIFSHFQMFFVFVYVCVGTVDRLSELLLGSAPFLTNYSHKDTESREWTQISVVWTFNCFFRDVLLNILHSFKWYMCIHIYTYRTSVRIVAILITGSEHLLNCSSSGCYWSTLVRMNVWLRLTGLTGSWGEGGLAQVLQSNTSATGTAKEVQAGSLWKVSGYTGHHSLAADQSGIRSGQRYGRRGFTSPVSVSLTWTTWCLMGRRTAGGRMECFPLHYTIHVGFTVKHLPQQWWRPYSPFQGNSSPDGLTFECVLCMFALLRVN